MTWPQAFAAYLKHQAERGLSPRTLEGRSLWISHFEAFCAGEKVTTVRAVTADVVARYRQALETSTNRQGRPLAPATVDGALTSARSFLRWAVAHDILLVDPTSDLVIRRRPLTLHSIPTAEEMETLLAAPDPTTLLGIRDRALLELLYGTGLRRRECFELNVDDVDLATGTVLVREGKGGKERLLPMGDHLRQTLCHYVQNSRAQMVQQPHERAFFLDMFGKRLAYASIGKRVNQFVRQSLGRVFGPHRLRHAMASHLIEGDADLRSVQEMLGHDHIQSTLVYTHLRPIERLEAYRTTHPRARWKPPKK